MNLLPHFLTKFNGFLGLDPPLPESQPIEVFGYETGKTGVINVTVHANPRPTFEWVVNGQRIKEGSHDNTGIIKAETTYDVVCIVVVFHYNYMEYNV